MKKIRPLPPLVMMLAASAFTLAANGATGRADTASDGALYSDPDGQSSATVVQVHPNSPSTQMILTNVKSIQVRDGIFIINWGSTATTLLPKEFVSEITVNKRLLSPPPVTPAVQQPAPPAKP